MSEGIIKPKEKDLGGGFVIRRCLPQANRRSVGPFIFWDHIGPVTIKPERGMDVRPHPHVGLATITYLFSGHILHRDSLGNEQVIRPNEVNWMTAGEWIVHSERSHAESKEFTLEGIQVWVALPKENEQVTPSFVHCREDELPKLEIESLQLRLVAGEFLGKSSPLPVYSDIFYLNGQCKGDSRVRLEIEKLQEAAVYVINGAISWRDECVEPGQMLCFGHGNPIEFSCLEDSEFMILGGKKLEQPPIMWWNLVATDQSLIERAKEKWVSGNFVKVVNDSEEFIPMPKL